MSRVAADKHYLDDVLSGASIGLLTSWYMTTKHPDRYELQPVVGSGGYGLNVRIRDRRGSLRRPAVALTVPDAPRRFRYEWEFGYAQMEPQGGTRLGKGDGSGYPFHEQSGSTVTARVDFAYRPQGRSRHEWGLRIAPFELRGFASVDDREMRTIYAVNQYRVRYSYDLLPDRKLSLKAGLGLERQHLGLELRERGAEPGPPSTGGAARTLLPVAHLHLGRRLTETVRVYAEVDCGAVDSGRITELATAARFRLAPQWELGLGWRQVRLDVENEGMALRHVRSHATTTISYVF